MLQQLLPRIRACPARETSGFFPSRGQAILVWFNPNRDAFDMVNEVNEMVKKFAERANDDALKKAVARSQLQIDAQCAREGKVKEEAVIEKC